MTKETTCLVDSDVFITAKNLPRRGGGRSGRGRDAAYNTAMDAVYHSLLAEVTAACRRCYAERLLSLAVFGSVGRGTPRPDSDIDLLLIAADLPDGPVARNAEFGIVRKAVAPSLKAVGAQGLHPELSAIIKTRAELDRGTPLLLDMTEDARILHDPRRVLAAALDRLRRRLRELGSRRIWRGHRWYWDLKPDYRPGEIFELFGP